MSLVKREYTDRETVITAENLNAIQDAIIALEDGLLTVDDDKSGEAITITDAANRGFKSLKVYGKTVLDREPSLDNPAEFISLASVAGPAGELEISVCGKNLFTGWDIGGVSSVTGAEEYYPDKRRTGFIPVIPGATYTISDIPSTLYSFAAFYDAEKKFISRSIASSFLTGYRTVDAPANARYMRVTIYENSATAGTIKEADIMANQTMILAGGTVEEYVAGKPIQSLAVAIRSDLAGIPVTSGGNYRDETGQQWFADTIDFGAGTEAQRISSITLDGSEQWYYASTNQYFYTQIADRKPGSDLLCNRLPVNQSLADNKTLGWWAFNSENTIFAITGFMHHGLASTVDELKAYLSSHPLTVMYITEGVYEVFSFDSGTKDAYKALHTNKPYTTIHNNIGAWMEAEYVVDAKKYFESIGAGGVARLSSVTLLASAWKGSNGLYSQVVTISGVTPYSKVDLLPSVEQLAVFHNKDVAFVTENDGGVITAYAIGDKPTNDYTMQVSITEVAV